MIKKARYFTKLLFIVLIVFAAYIIFKDLGKPPLDNWDEAWYGEVVKQIFKTKDLLILYWNGEFFFDKPPLYIWLSTFSSLLFGFSEFSLRFVSALSGLLIVVLILLYSYRKWGFVPSVLAFSTLILNNIFVWRARSGNVDLLAAFFIFISYFLILSKRKSRYFLLGIVFGLLYLTKESLVIFPFLIFVFHEFLFARKTIRKNLINYIKLFSIFISIPFSWLFLGYLKLGDSFIISAFNPNQRVGSISIYQFHLDYFWYAYYSLQRRYFYLFLIGIILLIRKITPMSFSLFTYSLGLLVFLSFAERNNNWYLVPSMPFWSLTIAYGTYKMLNFSTLTKYLSVPIIILLIVVSYKTFTVNILPILNTFSSFNQKESGKVIQKLSKKDDVIIRLDHLYPAAIYYSDRIFFASPKEADTNKYFMSRIDVVKGIKNKRFTWLMGTREEVEEFIKQNIDLKLKKIDVNRSESIIQVI